MDYFPTSRERGRSALLQQFGMALAEEPRDYLP
jgi:hypothetical protein